LRNGDDIATIVKLDPLSDLPLISTGWARSRLEVEYHCRLADKRLGAAKVAKRTRNVLWTVDAGVHVRTQVALGIENTPTFNTVVVRLSVVLVQPSGVLEELVTSFTEVVVLQAMRNEGKLISKISVAFPTVVMVGTLDVVLPESMPGDKVPITVIAIVVKGGVHHVLAVGGPLVEPAITRIAVR